MNIKNETSSGRTGEPAGEGREREVEDRLRRMRAVARRCANLLRKGGPPIDHGDLLYDEQGLPR